MTLPPEAIAKLQALLAAAAARRERAGEVGAAIRAELETRHDRSMRAFSALREVTDQPDVYYTTGKPLPRFVCTSARTMDTAHEFGDNPAEWYHPDLGPFRREWVTLEPGEATPNALITTSDQEYDGGDGGDLTPVGEPIRRAYLTVRRCRFCGFAVRV